MAVLRGSDALQPSTSNFKQIRLKKALGYSRIHLHMHGSERVIFQVLTKQNTRACNQPCDKKWREDECVHWEVFFSSGRIVVHSVRVEYVSAGRQRTHLCSNRPTKQIFANILKANQGYSWQADNAHHTVVAAIRQLEFSDRCTPGRTEANM